MSVQILKLDHPISCRLVVCAFAMLVAVSARAQTNIRTNPRSDKPDLPMSTHGTIKGAAEEIKRLYELYATEEKTCLQMAERKDNPASLPYKQISTSASKVWMAQRDASHLQLMGEPAAYDLSNKFRFLALEFRSLAVTYVRSPQGANFKVKLMNSLRKQKPSRDKKVQQGEQMMSQGQFELAEKQLAALGAEIYGEVVFISPSENKPYWEPVTQALGACDSKLSAKRKAMYQQQSVEVVKQLVAESRQFKDEADRVVSEIKTSGTATIAEGKTGNAVDAFAYIAGQWSKSSALLMRCQGIDWAFFWGGMGGGNAESAARKELNALSATAKDSLAALIEAAAQSTPTNEIAATYAGILREISIINRRAANIGLMTSCEPALKNLASKNQSLTLQTEKYDRATSEPLRWRAKFASQQADRLVKEYYSIASRMTIKHIVEKTNRPPVFGNVVAVQRPIARPTISQPANWDVYETATKLLGQKMSDEPMIRLTPTSKTAVVPYASGHYTNVAVPLPVEKELAELRRFLVVDETHPPLSIDAADAISSAELQDFEQVGGQVARLHLESLVTRFVALPDVASVLCPLGTLPQLVDNSSPATQACWTFDMLPHWAQHKYFTVELRKAAAQ